MPRRGIPPKSKTSGSGGGGSGAPAPTPTPSTPKSSSGTYGYTPKMPKGAAVAAPPPIQPVPASAGDGGDNSLIFILMMILLVLVFWKNIVVPMASIAWNTSNTDITTLPWKQFLIGFVFVGVVTFISSLGSGAYKAMLFFVAAMYVVYIVETQGGVVTNLANWASTPTNPPGQKGTPTGGPVG